MLIYILTGYFVLINLIAYIVCYVDKRKAIKNKYRIQEKTLLILSALGGALGFFIGMKHHRHKTKKAKFYITVPILMVLEIAGFIYLLYILLF